MNGPGKILQNERVANSLTIEQVHRDTRIKVEYLEAIENDDISVFPAELYYKNFLKAYSKYLLLEPGEMINIYEQVKIEKQQEIERLNRKDSLGESFGKFYKKHKRELTVVFILAAFLIVSLLGVNIIRKVYENYSINETEISNFLQEQDLAQRYNIEQGEHLYEQKQILEEDSSEDSEQLENSGVENKKTADMEELIKEGINNAQAQAQVQAEIQEKVQILSQSKPNTKSVGADKDLTLQINAKQNTWVKLVSDNRTSFEGILQKGHHYTSKAKSRFILKVGNVEGVNVYFNDEFADISKGRSENKVNTIEFKRD